jgi:DeoR/GlpR family transcriptional regulator of sugar metabolism
MREMTNFHPKENIGQAASAFVRSRKTIFLGNPLARRQSIRNYWDTQLIHITESLL